MVLVKIASRSCRILVALHAATAAEECREKELFGVKAPEQFRVQANDVVTTTIHFLVRRRAIIFAYRLVKCNGGGQVVLVL